MIGAIVEFCPQTHHGISSQNTAFQIFPKSLFHGRDKIARNHAADYGIHKFTYSLYVHREPWYNSQTIPLAWDLNDPMIAVEGKAAFGKFINLSSPGMALDALKKSENGGDLVIRLHETRGGKTALQISFNVPIGGWAEADLMENPLEDFKKADKIIAREVKPFEIVTYRIKL